MKVNRYWVLLQEYKRLLAKGKTIEANKLRYELAMKSLEGAI